MTSAPDLRIRTERPGDTKAIAGILGEAFAPRAPEGMTPVEVGLVERLRASSEWLPDYALVAEHEGQVIGFCTCTLGGVDGQQALGLGPLGVVPAHHGRGAGTALVTATIALARTDGYPYIALLGAPEYYGRFGFVPGTAVGIDAPDPRWGDHFQVLALPGFPDARRGVFRYASAFMIS